MVTRMSTPNDKTAIARQFEQLSPYLDERSRRRLVASESLRQGRGGAKLVAEITGMARSTINAGRAELRAEEAAAIEGPLPAPRQQIRRPGGGRKPITETQPGVVEALKRLVEPYEHGDPERPLKWTSKSLRKLATALAEQGFVVSHTKLGELLVEELKFTLQSNRKSKEGRNHPDRNAQFEHINARTVECQAAGNPVISVDTKKKELVGEFKNGGREWRPKGKPEQVQVHDFPTLGDGKAAPYGVYDIARNEGWVNVGISGDTAEFAVESIRQWWWRMGHERYPNATELMLTADCGGSNGYRVRLWKLELQHLANEIGMPIAVHHLPPGTSKWNKIEHRLFSFITQNWRGRPLVSFQTIVNLIASTTTDTGLTVVSRLDERTYNTKRKVSESDMAAINLVRGAERSEWNYTVYPSDVTAPVRPAIEVAE